MLDIPALVKSVNARPRLTLLPHPRLCVDADAVARLRSAPDSPMLQAAQARIERCAPAFAADTTFYYDDTRHNAHLIRARIMQTRIVTLLVRWLQTGDEMYRQGILNSVSAIDAWPQWSWIDWFQDRTPDTEAKTVSFDLSYGENCLTLALAYDLLFDTLSEDEKALFIGCIRHHRVFETFLSCVEDPDFKDHKGKAGGFLQNEKSNWLTVLCGGMGTLALAVYEEIPEAHRALFYCDEAVRTLMKFAGESRGAWPEGLSYYSYTLRYAIAFLESWERATGTQNPSYALPGLDGILNYFLDLMPGGVPCTFGDNNKPWEPLGFHYQIARRLGQNALTPLINAQYRFNPEEREMEYWPISAERLLFAPRGEIKASGDVQTQVVRFYPGSNVTILADRLPSPSFEMVIRGGNTNGAHEHNDLSSFFLVMGSQSMITSLSTDDYMDSTFSARRMEVFEMTPQAKNVFFINGVGMQMHSTVTQEEVEITGLRGIRMDCTAAMGVTRQNQPAADAYFRTFLMLRDAAFLIVDACRPSHAARMEARLHTYADVTLTENGAVLYGTDTAKKACLWVKPGGDTKPQTLYVSFTSDRECVLITGTDMATSPKIPSTALRWITKSFEESLVTLTLLSRVSGGRMEINDGTVCVELDGETYRIPLA